jgi:hypothetical protein
MKSLLKIASVALFASGCSFAARSPDMYRNDTSAALSTKANDIHVCYDGVLKANPHAAGKVTVNFKVETDQGKFTDIAVDKVNTTAPTELADCVVKSIQGLGVTPADSSEGIATFVWEFTPPAATAPAAVTAAKKS